MHGQFAVCTENTKGFTGHEDDGEVLNFWVQAFMRVQFLTKK